MSPLVLPILVPAALGLLAMAVPRRRHATHAALAVLGALGLLAAGAALLGVRASVAWPLGRVGPFAVDLALRADGFSSWAVAFVGLVTLATALYGAGWWRDREPARGRHHALVLWTGAAASAALLADDLLVLLVALELVTVFLYLLSAPSGDDAAPGAAKAFTMLSVGDVALVVAVVLVGLHREGLGADRPLSLSALAAAPLSTAAAVPATAYALLLVTAVAKAGALPLHSWVPTLASGTHPAVMGFLPAAIDKVLGIYLLARASVAWFVPSPALRTVVMVVGAVTILAAVLRAMAQHDLRRLLAFHAVSQVGYMLLGIGTGTVLGVMGGVFHMANNALYKSCLFLGAGVVERETGTTDLDRLGGLARGMPVTFGCMLVAALAIAGIPPLNGFASKWMIYEACVLAGQPWLLVVALLGSVLTLASFVKVLHGVFWGARPARLDAARERGGVGIPIALLGLAGLCVLLGVLAAAPLEAFVGPAAGLETGGAGALEGSAATRAPVHGAGPAPAPAPYPPGAFAPLPVAGLLLLGALALLAVAYAGRMRTRRVRSAFVGGEPLDREIHRFGASDFYRTVEELPGLSRALRAAERGRFDPYEVARRAGAPVVRGLRRLHTGLVQDYVAWCLVGAGAVLALLLWS